MENRQNSSKVQSNAFTGQRTNQKTTMKYQQLVPHRNGSSYCRGGQDFHCGSDFPFKNTYSSDQSGKTRNSLKDNVQHVKSTDTT